MEQDYAYTQFTAINIVYVVLHYEWSIYGRSLDRIHEITGKMLHLRGDFSDCFSPRLYLPSLLPGRDTSCCGRIPPNFYNVIKHSNIGEPKE